MGFDQMHIRHCILYGFKKGSKASQAARNIRSVYKNEAPSIRTCQRWFKQFKSGNFTHRTIYELYYYTSQNYHNTAKQAWKGLKALFADKY